MSGLTLRPLTRREVRRIYRWEMCAAFPRSERRPLRSILAMMDRGEYDALGFYQAGTLEGYAMLWRGGRYVLLDYLAVCEGKRGRGTGSEMLALLSERYAGFAGILAEAEAEEEDAPPEVNALRARRLSFYRRGGFTVLDYEADIFSVRYAMLLRTPGGPADSAAAMEAHRALYRSRLPAPLYRRFVHIPIQEKEGTRA